MRNLSLYFAKFMITAYTSILPLLVPTLMLNMNLSLTQAGALFSLFSLFNSLLQPFFGWIEDRLGYYHFLCFAPLWVGLFMGTIGLAPNYSVLILLLLFAGIGICAFHPASFAVVKNISSDRRTVIISFLLFATSMGFVAGPSLISIFISRFGIDKLYLISVLGVLTTLALYKLIPKNVSNDQNSPSIFFYPFMKIIAPIFIIFLLALTISITAMNLYSFVPILLRGKGASVNMIGFFLSAFSLGCAIGPLIGSLLAKHIGRHKIIGLSAFFSIVLILLFLSVQIASIEQMVTFLFLGMFLMFPFSLLIDMAQEKVPQYLGTVSSILGGFVWGCGGILIIFFAKIAKIFGIETLVGCLTLFPIINLGLILTTPSLRSQRTSNTR